MNHRANSRSGRTVRARQGGMVLLISLIALVAMTLAGLGLMRAITADTAISGNLAFRINTLDTGNVAIDDAVKKVVYDLVQPDASGQAVGYNNQGNWYSASMLTPETPGTQCTTNSCIKASGIPYRLLPDQAPVCTSTNANAATSYTVYDNTTHNCANVFIERMCVAGTLKASTTNCVMLSALQSNQTQYAQTRGGDSGDIQLQGNKVAVRVSIRVDGPRGTTTYVQAIVGQRIV